MASVPSSEFCLLNSDFSQDCLPFTVGGLINRLYFINAQDYVGVNYGVDSGGDRIIEDIILRSGSRAYFIDFQKDQNGATAELNGADGSGALHYVQTLTVNLNALTPRALTIFKKLALNNRGFVIVGQMKLLNGGVPIAEPELFALGVFSPMTITSQSPSTGVAQTDLQGGTIVLTGPGDSPLDIIRPDPAIFTSTTPNAEFIQTRLLTIQP
jgi:hypothetical protein